MNLAIAVVYMLRDEDERLLRTHLDLIARYTTVPYHIHAGVNRLPERLREILRARERVIVHDCPATRSRGGAEHAFYLEFLIRKAIESGASHVAVLHVDSFPIAPGWAEQLAGMVEPPYALATVAKNGRLARYTACLFFPRLFFLDHRPRLLLSEAEHSSPEYACYSREVSHHPKETGAGYCFRAYLAGLSWHTLPEAIPDPGNALRGNIFGGLIFHLDGAFRSAPAALAGTRDRGGLRMPPGLRAGFEAFLHKHLRGLHHHIYLRPLLQEKKRAFLDDPESYLDWFRERSALRDRAVE